MSNPSFSNIDRWLFELMEGNLSAEQEQQLEAFLLQHPELDVDRDMWEMSTVQKEEVVYPHQDRILRRKPVGLFMMAGFASIAIFVGLGIIDFVSTSTNSIYTQQQLANEQSTSTRSIPSTTPTNKQQTSKTGLELTDFTFRQMPNEREESNQSNLSDDGYRATVAEPIEMRLTNSFNSPLLGTTKTSIEEGYRASQVTNPSNLSNPSNPSNPSNNSNPSNPLNQSTLEIPSNPSNPSNLSNNSNPSNLSNPLIEDDLATTPAQPLDVESYKEKNYRTGPTFTASNRFSSTDYKESFSSRLSKAKRALARMMDNPVALKNLKDPYYHIPALQAMDVNFGSVGTLLATRVQTLSRAQWLGEENQQFMNQISVDGYAYGIRGGLGLQLNNGYYANGQIMNSSAAITYSPKFSVNRNILVEPSIRFKMGNKSLNSSKITDLGQAEMDRGNVYEFYPSGSAPMGKDLWYRDMGLGLMVNTKWFFIGVQGDNLFKHYDNIYSNATEKRAGRHFIATIGTDYESQRENISLSPYIVYQQNEQLSEAWLGVNARYEWITMGAAVSSNADLVGSLGMKFNRFAVTYNMDYTHSYLFDKQIISHQLSLRFVAFSNKNRQKF
ncbi:MAG: type IX secretion system membrane protein PorP/SprF [Crocinitomicaceae bacterium]|nr:type IX secretion system membrane protein PorP/SprF [Crocinitomicaceae bacterium]